MKRPRSRLNRQLGCNCGVDNVTSSGTDSDEQCDATYETDLTEPDDTPSIRKRFQADESHPALESGEPDDAGEFYNNPLDDTGIDLFKIPEDFDKAEGTILRQEQIETHWKQYCDSRTCLEPEVPKWREPEEALRQASNNDMYRFLGWHLKLRLEEPLRILPEVNQNQN